MIIPGRLLAHGAKRVIYVGDLIAPGRVDMIVGAVERGHCPGVVIVRQRVAFYAFEL
ncbi:hypothetical protein SDC9_182739 [bioreactor metagenome]|uniref:Uncharacterized protein n=1 Tax=bioreactor metagenome TaxID=1076179 RepID=A0A645HA38_9ZZZZ